MKALFDFDSFREVGDALLKNKSRSILTGFGIFWGLFMLLFLIGGGQGFRALVSQNFAGFASNAGIIISSNTSKPYKGMKEGRYWSLTMTDLERLKRMVGELDVVTPMIGNWGQTVTYGENSYTNGPIKGLSHDYIYVEEPVLKFGRYINDMDNIQGRKVCVIGKNIYEALFPEGGDPCGKMISVGGIYMQVVGVDFNTGGMSINGQAQESVVIPVNVARRLYNRGNNVDIICITAKSGIRMTTLEGRIREVLARNHLFDPTDTEAMMFLNLEQIFMIVDNLMRGINFLIWLVGIGTLLAGAIGVSNIMMVTVKERTVEIGIRRAIGAMPRDILLQIMSESITLTLLSGSLAIVFSVLILQGMEMANKSGVEFQISFWTAILSMFLLAALGLLAGLAPARRAMKIKPVDAMRDE